MSIRPSAKIIVAVLIGIGLGLAALFIWFRVSSSSLDGFYTVTDSFVDARRSEITNVLFVEVQSYDSVKIERSVKIIAEQRLADTAMKGDRDRMLLMHFFVPSDTAALTNDMIEELAYTNPEITEPRKVLRLIRGGYIVKVTYPSRATQPSNVQMFRSQFYTTQPGIKAKDLP